MSQKTSPILEKLCKWRGVFASWMVGTQAMNAPGLQALRDLMEIRILLRCELTALTSLLIEKGVFTGLEFVKTVDKEAALLDKDFERKFPGFRTVANGIEIFDVQIAQETMRKMGFPP